MQDRPTAPELLDALAEFLFVDAREWAPREKRFEVLVAANLCAVIARELRAGYEPSLADVALFRELIVGGSDPAAPGRGAGEVTGIVPAPEDAEAEAVEAARELAWLIRRGELDDRIEEVAVRLLEHVRRKLDVARPGYADPGSTNPIR